MKVKYVKFSVPVKLGTRGAEVQSVNIHAIETTGKKFEIETVGGNDPIGMKISTEDMRKDNEAIFVPNTNTAFYILDESAQANTRGTGAKGKEGKTA